MSQHSANDKSRLTGSSFLEKIQPPAICRPARRYRPFGEGCMSNMRRFHGVDSENPLGPEVFNHED
jgi:hypothetical protein